VGLGAALVGLGVALEEVADGEGEVSAAVVAVVSDGVLVVEGVVRGAVVVVGPSSSRIRTYVATSPTTTMATASRTQKPLSGVGRPLPGTVCRPTSGRYRAGARRRWTQRTALAT